jgi:hypothetical protein
MGKRVRFSKEFKLEAVRLLDLGKKPTVERGKTRINGAPAGRG